MHVFETAGHSRSMCQEHVFTEDDWSDLEGREVQMNPYYLSKHLAEKAAWEFLDKLSGMLKLTPLKEVFHDHGDGWK